MANHISALRRIRSDNAKRLSRRYQRKTCTTFVKRLRATTEAKSASEQLGKVSSMIDKLAKRGIIHKNKAANVKSTLARYVNTL